MRDYSLSCLSGQRSAQSAKIVVALGETSRLMAQIAEIIEVHTGFPLSDSQT